LAAMLAAALAAGALSGCGNKANAAKTDDTQAQDTADAADSVITENFANVDTNGTTVTFWHSMGGVNGEAMDYLVNKFNDENTDGITVEAVYQGEYDDTINKLKSAQIG